MRFGSVCSGIEAASVAWHPLGWKAAWLAEIEPFPAAVLAHHYPDVPNLGDMTKIAKQIMTGAVEAPDVLVGGTPCQAFSVAGMREGLADERGQLTIKYVELADAIDLVRQRAGEPPAINIWENVPGVLSSKDNAFGCFLAALAGEDEEIQPPGKKWENAGCVFGPARTVAWRVLDAQYFGVAQRRRRVFVVASARKDFDPTAVLFEFEGVRRDTAPSREAREETAGTLASRTGAGGFPGTDEACSGYLQPIMCMAHGQGGAEIATERSPTLTCNHEAPIAFQPQCVTGDITHTLKAEGFDASEDGTGRGQPIVPMAFQPGNLTRGAGASPSTEVFPTLKADHGRGSSDQNPHAAYSVALRGREGGATAELGDDLAGCLRASSGGGDKPHVLATTVREVAQTITSNYGKQPDNSDTALGPNVAIHGMAVRRLTPTECECLQGFPEMVKTCTITVFQHSNSNVCLSDQQSTNVLAALQSHKSPNNASPAEENAFPSNANAAEPNLNVGQASSSAPVLVNAQIDLERQHLQLHSQGKLLLSVSIADASEWCRLPIQAADFVQLSAALLTWLERKAPHGRAESRLNTSGSFPLLIGNLFASQSGQEIEELASDAGRFTSAVKGCMKSITSEAGQSSQNCDLILQTLLCCVSTAISSFIPEETRAASSYALSVEVSHGYTLIPYRNKPAADGPRYKALGNSMAVPCMAFIGRRIAKQIKSSPADTNRTIC